MNRDRTVKTPRKYRTLRSSNSSVGRRTRVHRNNNRVGGRPRRLQMSRALAERVRFNFTTATTSSRGVTFTSSEHILRKIKFPCRDDKRRLNVHLNQLKCRLNEQKLVARVQAGKTRRHSSSNSRWHETKKASLFNCKDASITMIR